MNRIDYKLILNWSCSICGSEHNEAVTSDFVDNLDIVTGVCDSCNTEFLFKIKSGAEL